MIDKVHIIVSPSAEEIRERIVSKRPITAQIHIELAGKIFPNSTWNDFPVVILGWWVREMSSLQFFESNSAKLHFMDGPYELLVDRLDSDNGIITAKRRNICDDIIFRNSIYIVQLYEEVISTAHTIITYLRSLNMWDEDCDKLERTVRTSARLP